VAVSNQPSPGPRSHDAIEANLFAFFQQLDAWPRIAVHDDGDCIFTISDLPFPLFNSVMRARVDDRRAGGMIEARLRSCRDRGVPMLWWTGPSTAPADLGDRLDRAGFLIEPAFGMIANLDSCPGSDPETEFHASHASSGSDPETQLAIERVRDRAALATWSRVLCAGFGAPLAFGDAFTDMADAIGLDRDAPFRHYLARAGAQPVATCSLFFGAGVAGIYDVSTLSSHRRRGIGAAITRHAMHEARASGYRIAILHASQLGLSTYRSLGFETICDIGQYVWTPENPAEITPDDAA
jgi:ribosomal protein S18 acetylase RimI-like enzyme